MANFTNFVHLRPSVVMLLGKLTTNARILGCGLQTSTAVASVDGPFASAGGQRRCMSRVVKKRITRLPNDYDVYQEEVDDNQKGPNDLVPLKLVNRNPRNLELLSREPKPLGWELETPTKAYWNKVVLEKSGKYLTAKVIHNSGRTLVTASTGEEAYKAQCDSFSDTHAARNVGAVLARRCLEAGILFVHKEVTEDEGKSQKVSAFLGALRDGGLKLKEPSMIFPRRLRDL